MFTNTTSTLYTGLSSATPYHWLSPVSRHRSSAVPIGCRLWRCWAAVTPAGLDRGGEGGGGITGKSLQVRQILDLLDFGVCVLNKN